VSAVRGRGPPEPWYSWMHDGFRSSATVPRQGNPIAQGRIMTVRRQATGVYPHHGAATIGGVREGKPCGETQRIPGADAWPTRPHQRWCRRQRQETACREVNLQRRGGRGGVRSAFARRRPGCPPLVPAVQAPRREADRAATDTGEKCPDLSIPRQTRASTGGGEADDGAARQIPRVRDHLRASTSSTRRPTRTA